MARAASCVALILAAVSGCVVVNPSNVSVSASPVPVVVENPRPTVGQTPYAHALNKVLRQQEKVSKSLAKQDWKDIVEEASDWIKYTHELSGYADTTANPARLRSCCDQLLPHLEVLRESGLRQHGTACCKALSGCDPILQQLSREFPTVVIPQPTPTRSAAPAPQPRYREPGETPQRPVQSPAAGPERVP